MLREPYRLRDSAQIRVLRQKGRSWHNPLLVLFQSPNDRSESRFAFSVSRRIGKAVLRNRVKRLMREAVRRRLPTIPGGWDVLLIARMPARHATFQHVDAAVADLLKRSHLQPRDIASSQAAEQVRTT
jgi:ribonuclease P protein component